MSWLFTWKNEVFVSFTGHYGPIDRLLCPSKKRKEKKVQSHLMYNLAKNYCGRYMPRYPIAFCH